MEFLINASNIKLGGGIQVADSICCSLKQFKEHRFIVVLSSIMDGTSSHISKYDNVSLLHYDVRNSFATLLFGRDRFLDGLIKNNNVECVLTIFGPSRWEPRCPHICGFARAQLISRNSPYFFRMGWGEKIRSFISNAIVRYFFFRRTKFFYSENDRISKKLEKSIKGIQCFTVTNYYNQVFDQPERWRRINLPDFDGCTILNIGTNYPHKNLNITIDIARVFRELNPDVKIRFVLTLSPDDFEIPEDIRDMFLLIGKVDIACCPSLYQQADIMLQPSLLECFSATYPEAMRMKVPIVTTDLDFSRELCGHAALYYSPFDAVDAYEKLMDIIHNPETVETLVNTGIERLKVFDSYEERPRKLIELCERVANYGGK